MLEVLLRNGCLLCLRSKGIFIHREHVEWVSFLRLRSPRPGQLSRQLNFWRTESRSKRIQQPVRSYSDKEALTSATVVPTTVAKTEAGLPSNAADRRYSSYSGGSLGIGHTGRVPYDSVSEYRAHGRAVSRTGLDNGRHDTSSILSWTVDTRSETNSIHTSQHSVLSFPVSQQGFSEDGIREILHRELSQDKPKSDSYLRLARDTLGVHHVETWTSDRLLEFAVLLSKGGLTSFGASLYYYLLFKECENLHGQQFLVRLLVKCLTSGQRDIRWSRLGRVTCKIIEFLARNTVENGSQQLADVLGAFLLCSPVHISNELKQSLLTMAHQAMDVDNWKALMRKDIVDLKDLLDLESRVLSMRSADQNTLGGVAAPSWDVWQKGSFRIQITNSGSYHIRQIVGWALQKAEDTKYYQQIEDYSRRGRSKQMYQATYLSLITRLVHEAGTYQSAFDLHLVINLRDTVFRLNEYESMAIVSLFLVNIKTTMSLMSRSDPDEYLSAIAVNKFFSNVQLLEDTMRLTLGKYFSTRDSSGPSRDGADEFILDLVRRAASQQRQWTAILNPQAGRGREMEMPANPDMTVTPDSPHGWQGSKIELPTRTMTRK